MGTVLDTPRLRDDTAATDWRAITAKMRDDQVFRSAMEANLAPYFERLQGALQSERMLASLIKADAEKLRSPSERSELIE
jgi:hypothetical protein